VLNGKKRYAIFLDAMTSSYQLREFFDELQDCRQLEIHVTSRVYAILRLKFTVMAVKN
jgi:hypothetical protein